MRLIGLSAIIRFLCVAFISVVLIDPVENGQANAAVAQGQPVRALHFVSLRVAVNEAKELIDKMQREKFNTLILGVAWKGSTALNSTRWAASPAGAWTKDDLLAVVNYGRRAGLRIVFEVKLLSHQNAFLHGRFPELMFNSRTYDPRKPKVYDIVFPVLAELIDSFHPEAILIGHDEVVGWTKRHYQKGILKETEKMLPASLFLEDTLKLHSFLKSKGVQTWMWGDMLISPDEFPSMSSAGLNGIAEGYGAALRRKIPKDIVICDWHYREKGAEFPSTAVFKQEGFRVLGATWKKERTIRNFSKYAANSGADGMIATTWFHVQNKEWEIVDQIISVSGQAFFRDFPDSKSQRQ